MRIARDCLSVLFLLVICFHMAIIVNLRKKFCVLLVACTGFYLVGKLILLIVQESAAQKSKTSSPRYKKLSFSGRVKEWNLMIYHVKWCLTFWVLKKILRRTTKPDLTLQHLQRFISLYIDSSDMQVFNKKF